MASKAGRAGTNGGGARKSESWIESFVAFTDNLESGKLFRRWTAISTIAAILEQKVWLTTWDKLYPNLYTILVAAPGVGKSSTIGVGRRFMQGIQDFHVAPTSMTGASMVQAMLQAKRTITDMKKKDPAERMVEYYSMTVVADELGAFLNTFKENDVIPLLTTFYDVTTPYERTRKSSDEHSKIYRPQLSILAGSTPSNLMDFIPKNAWGQGFTSRLIFIYSTERSIKDDFANPIRELPSALVHDLGVINGLTGEFKISHEYQKLVKEWKDAGEHPKPNHPKLVHYCTRRRAHLYKLSMVHAVDRGNELILRDVDFHGAIEWMGDAEIAMERMFEGIVSDGGQAMDEIVAWIRRQNGPVPEHKILKFTQNLVHIHQVRQVVDLLRQARRIKQTGTDREGPVFMAVD